VKRRPLAVVILLVLGAAALFLLQSKKAVTQIGLRPLFYLLADVQQDAERIPMLLTRVSVAEENRIGEDLARQYRSYFSGDMEEGSEAAEIEAYLSEVGSRVAMAAGREGIEYRFHYVPSKDFINAFALPGGQIFFGRGLLDLLESEDELAAILGHEIAHVDRRHCIERLQYELKARKLGLGGFYRLGRVAVRLFQAGYTKDKEFEADRAGLALAVKAGYAPAGALDVMDKFKELARKARSGPASPVEEAVSVSLGSWREYFRSHPTPEDRRTALEREILARGLSRDAARLPLKFPRGEEAKP